LLLFGVAEIAIEIGHMRQPRITEAFDFMNNPGAGCDLNTLFETVSHVTYQRILFPDPAVKPCGRRQSGHRMEGRKKEISTFAINPQQ